MPIQVKICGINDKAAFDAAIAARADWVGFVVFPPSPRFVTPAHAAALSARHPDGPGRVALLVNPTESQLAETLAALPFDAIQVYGELPTKTPPLPALWRAIGVASPDDLPTHTDAAALVIEPRAPPGADRPGGNARSLDPAILRGWTAPVPWFLAGGLTPSTVAAAIRATGAPRVDVSSGVETAPGQKDPALIAQFVANARAAL